MPSAMLLSAIALSILLVGGLEYQVTTAWKESRLYHRVLLKWVVDVMVLGRGLDFTWQLHGRRESFCARKLDSLIALAVSNQVNPN